MRALEVHAAIVATLKASAPVMALATGVYDHVPEDVVFPYIAIDDGATSVPSDTDDSLGSELSVTIHAWSRYRGQHETRQLQQTVYAALHRAALDVDDAELVTCELESQQTFLDDDGLTRHGVQIFRVLLDEVSA